QDASIFSSKKHVFSSSSLKYGLLALGIGIGIIVGALLDGMGMDDGPAYFASMFIFGGLGLILYYRISMSKTRELEEASDS
ncbi:MAG: DUF6249 domain-containing protein, partial [Saprospiraceae bacterium]|nr:DUF6249 domain-containing protein [Saprospiraceae bacterium]